MNSSKLPPEKINQSHENIEDVKNNRSTLTLVTAVFFMWGFITCLNDVLVPHLKASFNLNYTQSLLIQFIFFGAYFILGAPGGWLVSKIGYRNSIISGLLIAALGAILFWPAATIHSYPLFLGALFVLAGGITLLQVSANPYVTILGPEKMASSRLNLSQMFNSLGTTIAPWVGGFFILSTAVLTADQINLLSIADLINYQTSQANSVIGPYLALALILVLVALAVFILHPKNTVHLERSVVGQNSQHSFRDALSYRHVRLGALSIFVYVGAEVAIGSLLISFISQPTIGNMSSEHAAYYLSLYWGGAMVGRAIGTFLLRVIDPGYLLAIFSGLAALLVTLSVTNSGSIALWSLVSVGLFNSIMFPTIFSLATAGLSTIKPKAASLMIMAIVGGALLPLLQAMMADSSIGLNHSFILPILCYLIIVHYGLTGSKVQPK